MTESLVIDGLHFEIRRSEKRKTIGIIIERDGELLITAPLGCSWGDIERTASDKRFWVLSKLSEKQLMTRESSPREFVSGEGFYYLGRTYRLKLVAPEPSMPPLRLHHGRFLLIRDQREQGRAHFVQWYIEHGQKWLERRVVLLANRIGVPAPDLRVRDLGFRWGSCGQTSTLNFHWRTALLPPSISEYVVAHELAHLIEPAHGNSFWRRVERAVPDFVSKKRWLAENGSLFDL